MIISSLFWWIKYYFCSISLFLMNWWIIWIPTDDEFDWPVVVEFDFLESPVGGFVFLEVADVGVDFGVQRRRVEGETHLIAPYRLDRRRTALHHFIYFISSEKTSKRKLQSSLKHKKKIHINCFFLIELNWSIEK